MALCPGAPARCLASHYACCSVPTLRAVLAHTHCASPGVQTHLPGYVADFDKLKAAGGEQLRQLLHCGCRGLLCASAGRIRRWPPSRRRPPPPPPGGLFPLSPFP